MKQLILIRHSKSSWEMDVSDLERSLKKRGYNDAKLVTEALLTPEHNFDPDLILVSPALRAKLTAQIFIENLNWLEVKSFIEPKLYDFSGENTFDVIKSCDDSVEILVLFGHNPTFSIIASQMGSEFIDNIPTTGFVKIHFAVNSWSDVTYGDTIKTIFPKDLKI